MRNKNFLIFLFGLISLLCLFYLYMSFSSRKVENEAKIATSNLGPNAYNDYLDSVWTKPVVNVLGIQLTYQQLKEKELGLGLDLKGGMHIVLEVSNEDLIYSLANNPGDLTMRKALERTSQESGLTQDNFNERFISELSKMDPEKHGAYYFAGSRNQDNIDLQSSDQRIVKYLDNEMNLAVDRTFEILRKRIDRFGVTNPNIQRLPGTNRIQIELAGVDQPERVRKLLRGMANLEFWEVWNLDEIWPFLSTANEEWIKNHRSEQSLRFDEIEELTGSDTTLEAIASDVERKQMNSPLFNLNQSPGSLVYLKEDTATINSFFTLPEIVKHLPKDLVFRWSAKPDTYGNDSDLYLELYALRGNRQGPVLQGNIIRDAQQSFDRGPSVTMSMNSEGARQWRKITRQNQGRQVAIVLDGQVYTAPEVQTEIPNGQSSITGNFSIEEAKDLANILKTGKMPVKVNIVEEAVIGPTLGKAAINQGLVSLLAGFSLIIIFMILYYGRAGSIADLAVFINIIWIMGILAQLGSILTLPGIAGLVLTIGMAVDANVLIFERIREELRRGQDLRNSIKSGFDRAYSAILDSNITTFLTAFILYIFGVGGVKGFATVLMIGVVCSVLSAVFVTRMLLEWLYRRNLITHTSFETVFSRKFKSLIPSFDFIRYRKTAYIFSALLIVVGLGAALVQKGYNLGVDFKGGRTYIVTFDDPVESQSVRSELAPLLGEGGLEVKSHNNDNTLRITTGYRIEDVSEAADNDVKSLLLTGLEKYHSKKPQVIGSSKVGPSIASDFKSSSRNATIFALSVIFFYILVRFRKWQYGLGAAIALVHDVLMVFAIYSILGLLGIHLEIDQIFIAAILTIIGYSINDTVVVFDRIREFSGKLSNREDFGKILNPAINNTLSRTVITSFTVLMVVVVLVIFGGDLLRGFSVALVVGVIFGTYSSIFIASPLVLDLYGKGKRIGKGKRTSREQSRVIPATSKSLPKVASI